MNVKKVCASSWSFAALRCDGHVPCLVPVGFVVRVREGRLKAETLPAFSMTTPRWLRGV